MTNFQSIAGGTLWMLISSLLFFAALTPVSAEDSAAPEIAAAPSPTASA